jgi:hypothetical protein
MKEVVHRLLRYLLLFLAEYVLVFIIGFFIILISGFWGDTPAYWIPIFFTLLILLNLVWGLRTTKGKRKNQIVVSIISGFIAGLIIVLSDAYFRMLILRLFHLQKVLFLLRQDSLTFAFTIMFIMQLVFWELMHRMKVVVIEKRPRKNPASA